LAGFVFEPWNEFGEGGIEVGFEPQDGWKDDLGFGVPDDVQNDSGIGRIPGVMVALPSADGQIQFDIPRNRWIVPELDHRLSEIRTGFAVPVTGVQNPNRLTLEGDEPIPAHALMTPDLLQPTFGGWVGGFLAGQGTSN